MIIKRAQCYKLAISSNSPECPNVQISTTEIYFEDFKKSKFQFCIAKTEDEDAFESESCLPYEEVEKKRVSLNYDFGKNFAATTSEAWRIDKTARNQFDETLCRPQMFQSLVESEHFVHFLSNFNLCSKIIIFSNNKNVIC
jgi:hypothetical protein